MIYGRVQRELSAGVLYSQLPVLPLAEKMFLSLLNGLCSSYVYDYQLFFLFDFKIL